MDNFEKNYENLRIFFPTSEEIYANNKHDNFGNESLAINNSLTTVKLGKKYSWIIKKSEQQANNGYKKAVIKTTSYEKLKTPRNIK